MGTQTRIRTSTDVKRNYNGSGSKKGIKEQILVLRPENFDLFPSTANRLGEGIGKNHITALKHSMNESGFLQSQPIIVDENMNIIDGHHRFVCAKELGIPLYYKVVEGAKLYDYAKATSVVKKWSSADWAEDHASTGDQDYIKLKGLVTQFNLRLTTAIPLAESGSTRDRSSFIDKMRDKKFHVKNWGDAFSRAKMLQEVRDISAKTGEYARYHNAWIAVSRHQRYNHKHFMTKLRKYVSLIREEPHVELYIKSILAVYNYRTKKGDKISYSDFE